MVAAVFEIIQVFLSPAWTFADNSSERFISVTCRPSTFSGKRHKSCSVLSVSDQKVHVDPAGFKAT